MSLRHYYDEVLLINKVNMSYEPALAKRLCEKFRVDALTVFFFGIQT